MYKALHEWMDNEITFYIDLVMVIDATQDSPFIRESCAWQDFLAKTYEMIRQSNFEYGRVWKLRVKIMYFRDFYFDSQYAFGESPFYELSREMNKVLDYIGSINSAGGGDFPESGLEALWLAMHADYVESDRCRRIITLFTNAPAHHLEDYDKLTLIARRQGCCSPVNYPEQVPRTIGELYYAWENWNHNGRGWLCLIAPDEYPWPDIEVECSYVARFTYNSMEEVDLNDWYWSAIFGS